MKNILIMGVAKAGKSTFANKFDKKIFNHIPVDYFTSSLKHNFSEIGISSNVIIDKESSKKLSLLLSRVIKIIEEKDEKFIIDSAHIYPEDIMKYIDLDKWDVYCIAYPNIDALEKLKLIRKYDDSSDWTYNKTDEELLKTINELVKISRVMEMQSKNLGIKFIDSSNYENLNVKKQ